jgi:general secretion pathway protein G
MCDTPIGQARAWNIFMNKLPREQGFTLIEVMVVVVILGILAAILVPKVMDRPEQARQTKARQDIRALEAALNLYKLDNYVYPSTDQGLEALVEKPSSPEPPNWKEGGYLDRLPQDPWKQDYMYLSPGAHGVIDIYSLGPDQAPGTEDDVGNWELK